MHRNLDATEHQVREQSEIYFIEVSSNVYLVKKCRDESFYHKGEYVNGTDIAFVLNKGCRVGIKSIARDLITNFQVYLSHNG